MVAVKDFLERLLCGLHCEGESVYALCGGGGLGSEITPWVEWVTGDEALGPIVGADSELVRQPCSNWAWCRFSMHVWPNCVCVCVCRKFGLYPSRIGCTCCTNLTYTSPPS